MTAHDATIVKAAKISRNFGDFGACAKVTYSWYSMFSLLCARQDLMNCNHFKLVCKKLAASLRMPPHHNKIRFNQITFIEIKIHILTNVRKICIL